MSPSPIYSPNASLEDAVRDTLMHNLGDITSGQLKRLVRWVMSKVDVEKAVISLPPNKNELQLIVEGQKCQSIRLGWSCTRTRSVQLDFTKETVLIDNAIVWEAPRN